MLLALYLTLFFLLLSGAEIINQRSPISALLVRRVSRSGKAFVEDSMGGAQSVTEFKSDGFDKFCRVGYSF